MSSTLALMLQITATNGAAGILNGLKKSLVDMGRLGKENAQHFDDMTRHLQKAGNAVAAGFYIQSKLKPGVQAAADLEEAMLNVKANIAQVGDKADDLTAKLQKVRDTGRQVSKVMPFSATEVVQIQNEMLKAGVGLEAVVGPRGAAYAGAALSSLSDMQPQQVGQLLARIGKQFNFKDDEYGRAADLLARADKASPGTLQELMYSLKQSGATQRLLGVSFKDSVTMAGALAPLGFEAGTAANRFILDSAGLTKHQREAMLKLGLARMHDGKFDNLLYKKGKYIGLDPQIAMMREKFNAIKGDNVKAKLAHDIWGQEGMRAALMTGTGDDLFRIQAEAQEKSLAAEEQMIIRMSGFNMATKAAAGTVQTMLATAFTPALDKATALSNKINDAADSAAQWLEKHPGANNAVAGAGAGLVGLTLGYGAFQLMRGGISGMKMLRGIGGTAGGIATGKAIEAATGVTPVFVTNWPASMGGGLAGTLADTAAGAGAGAGGAAAASRLGLKSLMMRAGLAAAPLAAMYGVSEWAGDTSHDQQRAGGLQSISAALSRFLGVFGFNKDKEIEERRRKNREGQDSSAQTINIQIDGRTVAQVVNDYNSRDARRH